VGEESTRDYAAEWKAAIAADAEARSAAAPVEVRLPSGLRVLAREIGLHQLFDLGKVPDALTPIVFGYVDAAEGKGGEQAVAAVKELIDSRWADFVAVVDFVWMQAVVEPRFARTTAEAIKSGAISLQKVGIADRIALFNYCQGMGAYRQADDAKEGEPATVGAAVASFRDQESDRAVRVGEGLQGVWPRSAGDDRDTAGELAGVPGPAHGADAP
jgi:hypothetical protein